jgi:organic radical activating enzyme
MIRTIVNKQDYVAQPFFTSDEKDYDLRATLFGKEWAMYDDFWMRHIHVKMTDRCDAHCPFCIEKDSHIKEDRTRLTANLETLLTELDQQQMDGTVSITGGEPSLCAHAGEVVDIIKRHNRFLNINTNFHHTIDSTLDPDWLNISRHQIDQDPYTRIWGLDFGMLDEYKKEHKKTKARIQCVLHPHGLQSVDDIRRFIDVYASSLLIDDFSFRRLINTKDGEAERDLFVEFKEYLFNHATFVEQTIQDYYIYEIYELDGNLITISFSDMALLKKLESREPDNLLREIIIHPDGLVSGSWYRDRKIIIL